LLRIEESLSKECGAVLRSLQRRLEKQREQATAQLLGQQEALRSVVAWTPEAMETADWGLASVAERGQSNSTEKGWRWRLEARLLSVFVAFSLAARIIVRPKTSRVLSFTSLDRSRPH
jgi:hypothetical protein